MRMCIALLLFACVAALACEDPKNQDTEMLGIWYRVSQGDTYTLELNDDWSFTESCDNEAMDPNFWDGTYTVDGNNLKMRINDPFTGSVTLEEYTMTIVGDELSLTNGHAALNYTRKL